MATASPNATDALSGIAVASCAPVVTSVAGPQTVSCAATDVAGNTATALANYTVSIGTLGPGITTCNGAYAGTGDGVLVPLGAVRTLLPGTHVNNDIVGRKGGTLIMNGVILGGDLNAAETTGIQITGGTIAGDLTIRKGPIGTIPGGNFVRNVTITGSVDIEQSTAAIEISGNTIGKKRKLVNNAPNGVLVSNNHVGESATCSGNVPQTGSGNTAGGSNRCP